MEKVVKAWLYADLAFSNNQTAIAYAMSYYIATVKGVLHGIASSFVILILIDNILGRYDFGENALIKIFENCPVKNERLVVRTQY